MIKPNIKKINLMIELLEKYPGELKVLAMAYANWIMFKTNNVIVTIKMTYAEYLSIGFNAFSIIYRPMAQARPRLIPFLMKSLKILNPLLG